MELTPFHLQVLKGEICPYCKSKTKLIPANQFYQHDIPGVDFIVACKNYPRCDSFTHSSPNSTKPNGRLVSKSAMRKRAKAYEQWNKLISKDYESKSELKLLLATFLNVPIEYSDICYLNAKNCLKVETWCIKMMYHYQYKQTGKFIVPMTVRNGKRKKITIIEQTGPHTSIVEFDEDEYRMEINTDKIFYYKPK